MSDYADFVNDGLIDNYFKDLDNPYLDDNWVDEQVIHSKENSSNFPLEKNFDYIKMPLTSLVIDDVWLMRKGIVLNCKLNKTVIIRAITERAILFEFEEEWINVYDWQMKGLQFWLPKSVLYKHKKHKKIIYIPKWAKIKIINKPE